MPWTFNWHSTEVLSHDFASVYYEDRFTVKGTDWLERHKKQEQVEITHSQLFDYIYFKKDGTAQERIATVTVERRKWYLRCWPWYKKVNTAIWVKFDQEVGEGSGSWKGGVTGSGYDILPNETPEQCLRRMEQFRTFDR